jgi:DNA helicase-2/ATP-dependent DNA helicase PcrA
MQAIFGWQGNELADWEKQVCTYFPVAGELNVPWRWRNAGTEAFSHWLLHLRKLLINGTPIDLRDTPREVAWIQLDGTDDRSFQLRACQTKAPTADGNVLIIGKSTSPSSQQEFASQTPGAVTVEAVDLKDLVNLAKDFDFQAADALEKVVTFAASVMTNVGGPDLIRRVAVLQRGTERRAASEVERAALRFVAERSPRNMVDLLVEIGKDAGVRTYRPAVVRACIKALQSCDGKTGNTFYNAAVRAREQNRLLGRPLPRRAVGSTLLLKGLEADVAVVLNASELDARNFYVAATRGSRQLVVCSPQPILTLILPRVGGHLC